MTPLFLVACTPDRLEPELVPSRWIPAAARVEWTGPAGHATLTADGGPFAREQVVAEATVEAGTSSLPLTLLPPGHWRWRVEVDTGDDVVLGPWEPYDVPALPPELGELRVSDVDRDQSQLAASGYWVGYQFGFRWEPQDAIPIVVDGEGEVVWWAPSDPDGGLAMRVKPSNDRTAILVLDDFQDGSRRVLYRYPLDGSDRVETSVPAATHDFWENDDGTVTYVSYVRSDTERIPGQPTPAVSDQLRTVPEGSRDGVAEVGFDFFADFPRDPWYPCDHADYDAFVPLASEWSHTNSLIRSPLGDGWLVLARYFDAVLAVDGHERLWQIGGDDATLTATEPAAGFHHGHASHAWLGDDGLLHLLVFDNRTHTARPVVSRVVELAIDPVGGTVSAVWELPDPEGSYTGFLGDARRLPNGTTLVQWGGGRLIEYLPTGDPVWTLKLDGPLGRGFWVPELQP